MLPLCHADTATGLAVDLQREYRAGQVQYLSGEERLTIAARIGIREARAQPERHCRVIGMQQQRLQIVLPPRPQPHPALQQRLTHGRPPPGSRAPAGPVRWPPSAATAYTAPAAHRTPAPRTATGRWIR